MSIYFTALVSLGVLSPLVVAVGAAECSERETLLRPIANKVTPVTDCLMECTGMTYIRKLQLQDNHNIRLKDSTEGDLGEYCWSTELKCTVGESFHRAYVVLPVDVSAVAPEQLEVKVTAPAASTLHADGGPSTIADTCGLRYEAGEQFSRETAGTSFCIQVVTQEDVLGDKVLKCPPYLVTFWQRNPNRSNQQGYG
ncbi:hypothetical protein EXN66_Car017615 [Channa argus]|uniref:Uncharacterized protein n=1 Tax=Channa argus TaxID=215402 RepID=A0A6G1QHI0_CHAAH|nr:hypothetical protein EXN66_Car017615 [Channa argus]KAK2888175.1 hypothetical protein Q8A73_019623 [Channa argus]